MPHCPQFNASPTRSRQAPEQSYSPYWPQSSPVSPESSHAADGAMTRVRMNASRSGVTVPPGMGWKTAMMQPCPLRTRHPARCAGAASPGLRKGEAASDEAYCSSLLRSARPESGARQRSGPLDPLPDRLCPWFRLDSIHVVTGSAPHTLPTNLWSPVSAAARRRHDASSALSNKSQSMSSAGPNSGVAARQRTAPLRCGQNTHLLGHLRCRVLCPRERP